MGAPRLHLYDALDAVALEVLLDVRREKGVIERRLDGIYHPDEIIFTWDPEMHVGVDAPGHGRAPLPDNRPR
jgi:hypothetical protein